MVGKQQPNVEALVFSGNKIITVGTKPQNKQFINSKTDVIDLKGNFVMPGFNDAYIHLADGCFLIN